MDDPECGDPGAQPDGRTRTPDPQGQAALLLVESLIHGLVAKSTLSIADAVAIVDIAADVKAEVALDAGEDPRIMKQSLMLLNAISSSLRRDLLGG